jgi:hypothetical protein
VCQLLIFLLLVELVEVEVSHQTALVEAVAVAVQVDF